MDRRILITGGSGYIGSALVPVVAKDYPVVVLETMTFGNPIEDTPNVSFIQGDIRDGKLIDRIFENEQISDVIHLAGIVTDELVDMNPGISRDINNTAMGYLCSAAARHAVRRFIYASSSSVYGTSDDACSELSPTNPMTEYAASKLYGEHLLFDHPTMCNVAVRSATAAGPAPRMRFDTIVNVFSKQAYFDKRITVHGGDQWRTNIHVADIADLYRSLLDLPRTNISGHVFNASRSYNQASELAEMVRDQIPCEVFIDKTKPDNRHYRMASNKITDLTGWRPQRTIQQAITDNLEYFESGAIAEPDSDLYVNTRRMASFMKGEQDAGQQA